MQTDQHTFVTGEEVIYDGELFVVSDITDYATGTIELTRTVYGEPCGFPFNVSSDEVTNSL